MAFNLNIGIAFMETTYPPALARLKIDCNQVLKQQDLSQPCLFNLIVYTQETHSIRYLQAMVEMILSQFPCRIIFIQEHLSDKGKETSELQMEMKQKKEKDFSCEQVFINVSEKEIDQVYFLLLPLLVPDLPIYVFWGQDPTTSHSLFPHLEKMATRLFFDSETTDDLQKFSQGLLSRLQNTSIQIVDMNWARITGWREVFAQVFDCVERLTQLETAQQIQIIYNNRPSELSFYPMIQAIYFQAWIASRLGWTFQKAEKRDHRDILTYRKNEQSHQIELIPQVDENFEAEEILEIKINGLDGYENQLKRTEADQVKVHAHNQSECELPFTLLMPSFRSARTFMQEIFFQQTHAHYPPLLNLMCAVKWSQES